MYVLLKQAVKLIWTNYQENNSHNNEYEAISKEVAFFMIRPHSLVYDKNYEHNFTSKVTKCKISRVH